MHNINKIKLLKILSAVLIATISFGIFWFYLRGGLSGKAYQDKVAVTMSPAAVAIQLDEQKTISVILQTSSADKKISGFDLYFLLKGNAIISQIKDPSVYPSGNNQIFTKLFNDSNHISYIVNQPASQLPSAVKIDVVVTGVTFEPNLSLMTDTSKSKVVGTNGLYSF